MTEALSTLEELIESYLAPDLTAPKRRDIQDELAKRLHGAGILGSFDRDLFTRFGGEVLLRRRGARGDAPQPGVHVPMPDLARFMRGLVKPKRYRCVLVDPWEAACGDDSLRKLAPPNDVSVSTGLDERFAALRDE